MAFRFSASNADIVSEQMRRYGRNMVERALPAALNKTITGVRTDGVRMAAAEMGVTQKVAREGTRIEKASRARPLAAIIFAGRPLPLIGFDPRQTKAGVSAKAYGQRKVYRGTFLARFKSGGVHVAHRKGKARLPIRKLWGPGLANTVSKPVFLSQLNEKAKVRLRNELRRAVTAVASRGLPSR